MPRFHRVLSGRGPGPSGLAADGTAAAAMSVSISANGGVRHAEVQFISRKRASVIPYCPSGRPNGRRDKAGSRGAAPRGWSKSTARYVLPVCHTRNHTPEDGPAAAGARGGIIRDSRTARRGEMKAEMKKKARPTPIPTTAGLSRRATRRAHFIMPRFGRVLARQTRPQRYH